MNKLSGSWKDFEAWLEQKKSDIGTNSKYLHFRGQKESGWHLDTTLERRGKKRISFQDYYETICRIAPMLETVSGVKAPEFSKIRSDEFAEKFYKEDQNAHALKKQFPQIREYEYLVYLRHHGFPSPLLDWSRSPYVAAFFAFQNPSKKKKCSIYVYCETLKNGKTTLVGSSRIRTLGPYVKSHPRHFYQQAVYTICESYDDNYGWIFDSHQAVFDNNTKKQDYLWRFDIPSTERIEVLKYLDRFNLNAYSLFNDEESLLESLWTREWEFMQLNPAE